MEYEPKIVDDWLASFGSDGSDGVDGGMDGKRRR